MNAYIFFASLASLLSLEFSEPAFGSERTLIVPKVSIRPSEALRAEKLTSRTFIYSPDGPSRYIERLDEVEGLVAHTLLPANKPIPRNAIKEPKLVGAGEVVTITYELDGISIATVGTALQNAKKGETLRVRNSQTGASLTGIVIDRQKVRVTDP